MCYTKVDGNCTITTITFLVSVNNNGINNENNNKRKINYTVERTWSLYKITDHNKAFIFGYSTNNLNLPLLRIK